MIKSILHNRYKKSIIKIIKIIIELVYPVDNERGAPVIDPEGPDDGQDQSEAGREEAQHLIRQAHGLSRGQRRVPDLQDPLAGRQRLLEAAIFRN
jgi:hypothetical protein